MLKVLLVACILFLPVCHAGQAQNAQLARQGIVSKQDYRVELPFRYIDRHVFIDVAIRGRTYTFLLDSGYELSAIDSGIGVEIGAVSKSRVSVSGTSFETRQATLVEVPRLAIAGVDFDGTAAVLQDLSMVKKHHGCIQVHGIIGNNVMRKAAWQIDYPARVIRLSDRSAALAIGKQAHPVRMKSRGWGLATLDLAINGAGSDFLFDTGSSGGFTAMRSLQRSFDPAGKAHYLHTDRKSAFIAGSVRLGDIALASQIVSLEDSPRSLVGNGFFENFVVTIDWANDLLWLDPRTQIPEGSLDAFQASLHPDYADNTLRLRNQWKSHALSPVLENDARVLRIDGRDVSALDRNQLCALWNDRQALLDSTQLELVVQATDGERAITLVRKRLLPAE
ncbi:MAG: retropepsin-like aspartic protease [Thermomonas sp.]